MSISTQNQAFNALLFTYRNVLHLSVTNLQTVTRARRKPKLPVVLTQKEISTLFSLLPERSRLICQTIYGAGMRLNECLAHFHRAVRAAQIPKKASVHSMWHRRIS